MGESIRSNEQTMLGYRVTFMDMESDNLKMEKYQVRLVRQHGWVIQHPQFEVPFFLNMSAEEKIIEVLGEL